MVARLQIGPPPIERLDFRFAITQQRDLGSHIQDLQALGVKGTPNGGSEEKRTRQDQTYLLRGLLNRKRSIGSGDKRKSEEELQERADQESDSRSL